MTDARALLDAYAARSAGLDGTNSIGTIGELAEEAITALRDVLDAHRVVRKDCRACSFPWPCATVRLITRALEGT